MKKHSIIFSLLLVSVSGLFAGKTNQKLPKRWEFARSALVREKQHLNPTFLTADAAKRRGLKLKTLKLADALKLTDANGESKIQGSFANNAKYSYCITPKKGKNFKKKFPFTFTKNQGITTPLTYTLTMTCKFKRKKKRHGAFYGAKTETVTHHENKEVSINIPFDKNNEFTYYDIRRIDATNQSSVVGHQDSGLRLVLPAD